MACVFTVLHVLLPHPAAVLLLCCCCAAAVLLLCCCCHHRCTAASVLLVCTAAVLQVDTVVQQCLQALADGHCPVIGLQSTGEARTAAYVKEAHANKQQRGTCVCYPATRVPAALHDCLQLQGAWQI
jgi:hypothetical protein